MKLLHIHADFPDGSRYPSTAAVSNLLDLVPEHEHWVLAVHRTANPLRVGLEQRSHRVWSLSYWGLPFGLALGTSLRLASRQLRRLVAGLPIRFELVHGHKLAVDGLLAADVAKALAVPYLISVRGGTDVHIVRHKPSLRHRWRAVLEGASHVFWVSKWAQPELEDLLKVNWQAPMDALPNPVRVSLAERPSRDPPRARFVTVASFHQYKRKGLVPLIRGLGALVEQYPDIHLDIYGGGCERARKKLEAVIRKEGLVERVHLLGVVPSVSLIAALRSYTALLLPSRNESFGMTYVEALLAGTPILYHAKTGIDGYLTGRFGERVQSQQTGEIRGAIERLIEHQQAYRADISAARSSGILTQFAPESVAAIYRQAIDNLFHGRNHHGK